MSAAAAADEETGQAEPLFHVGDARTLSDLGIESDSVDLVVTSPPYPLVAMWDEAFASMSDDVPAESEWTPDKAFAIFEAMHAELDRVWVELKRVTKKGAIVVINIGDATRSVGKVFHLFPNGARATMGMIKAGFTSLPQIYWKKPTNKPNAFLGSGFFPVNCYVTLDHEHILIFRNGTKRVFPPKDPVREKSKFTKEERNVWFTQTWDIRGIRQETVAGRRNAAFGPEIPRRLIRMFSVEGDTVLDPFVGTGTTAHAAVALGRRGIGVDLSEGFIEHAKARTDMRPASNGASAGAAAEPEPTVTYTTASATAKVKTKKRKTDKKSKKRAKKREKKRAKASHKASEKI